MLKAAIKAIKDADPELGAAKVHKAVKEANPTWQVRGHDAPGLLRSRRWHLRSVYYTE